MSSDLCFIDESLAKGFASRFMNETDDRLEEMFSRLEAVSGYTTKKGWRIHARKIESLVQRSSYGTYWLGTSSDPAFVVLGMDGGRARFKEWEERSLTATVLALTWKRGVIGPFEIPLSISHHCLSRIIQRTRRLQSLKQSWNFDIIKQSFRPILGWAAFWKSVIFLPTFGTQILAGTKAENCRIPDYTVKPVIPSSDGLFLCETSSSELAINVRTFVAAEQLDEAQSALREFLIQCYRGFEVTALPTHPWGYFKNFFDARSLVTLLQARIETKEYFVKEFLYEGVSREHRNNLEETGFLKSKIHLGTNPLSLDPLTIHRLVNDERKWRD
jgi:hypothetical protein